MKITLKRFLCLLLTTASILSAAPGLSACAATTEDDPNTEATKASTNVELETADSSYICELPDDLNYGEEITILYCKMPGRDDELVSPEVLGVSRLTDSVHERNVAVEENLDITFSYVPSDSAVNLATTLSNAVRGNDDSYQIVSNATYKAVLPAMEGNYLNLSALDNIDTSKHYWTQGYNDMVTFTDQNKQFLATGPVAISLFRYMYLTIYNKDLFENNHLPDLYEIVKAGEWTLDYQAQIIADRYVDQDGKTQRTKDDFYGFVTGDTISVDPYMVSTDTHMIVKDEETADLMFNENIIERLSAVTEKVNALYASRDTYVFKGVTYDDVGKNDITEVFAAENAMMATIMFYNMEVNLETLKALNYGIAPMPKLNVEQTNYYSYVQDQVSSFGISSAIGKKDEQEMLAAVLEMLAYQSYLTVRPAYYDYTLSTRFMNTPESKEVLDMIFDTLYFDFSSTCSNIFSSCIVRDNLRPILSASGGSIASSIRTWESSVNSSLRSFNQKLNSSTSN